MGSHSALCLIGVLAFLLGHLGCQSEAPPPAAVQQSSGSLQTIQDAYIARQMVERHRAQIEVLRDSVAQLGRVQRELELRVMVLERLQTQPR